MSNLKFTGSPTESAQERDRVRRRHIPWDGYDPNDGRTVRGRATSSLLSGRGESDSQQHLEMRGSPTFGIDRCGRSVLRLPGAQRRGGSVGERRSWVPGEIFRREFGLPGDTESEIERAKGLRDGGDEEDEEYETVFPQRHVRFEDDRSLRPGVQGPPYVGIFGDEIEEYEYDGEEFEDEDDEYSPNDFVYDRRRPVSGGLPRRSLGSSIPSTGEQSVPYSFTERRSTIDSGPNSLTRPLSEMPGRWPSSSRSPSAQSASEPTRRTPGHYPSSSSAPASPSTALRISPPRTGRQATLRTPTREYSPIRAPWRPGIGRDASPYSPHEPRSSSPVPPFPYVSGYGNIRCHDSAAQQPRHAARSPRLVQRSHNHWSISEGGSPIRSSSGSIRPPGHGISQPLRQRTPRPYTGPRSRSSPRQNSLIVRPNPATWSKRRNAELEALRAENQGLRVHNEELQQTLREILQDLSDGDESEDEDTEAMASGALQEDSDFDSELVGNFEFWSPTPPASVYESTQTHNNAGSSGSRKTGTGDGPNGSHVKTILSDGRRKLGAANAAASIPSTSGATCRWSAKAKQSH